MDDRTSVRRCCVAQGQVGPADGADAAGVARASVELLNMSLLSIEGLTKCGLILARRMNRNPFATIRHRSRSPSQMGDSNCNRLLRP